MIPPIKPEDGCSNNLEPGLNSWTRRALGSAAHGLLVLLLTAALTILLVRWAPGFGLDERMADVTLGSETRAQIAAQVWSGWGISTSFGIGVNELIASRWWATGQTLAGGLLLAWGMAMFAVLVPFLAGRRRWTIVPGTAAVFLLAIPAGVLSLAAFIERLPVAAVIAAAVFPRVYLFLRNRFGTAAEALHVVAAEARGVPRVEVALWHILRPELDELAALGAVSLKMALSAVIPAEVFGDVPGLGQAVWKAAQGRDLALILPLTLLFAALLQTATWLASLLPGHAPNRTAA